MEKRDRRRTRKATPGSRLPSDVLADNIRAYRFLQNQTQEKLAARMTAFGHDWTAGTVGFVERNERAVNVDELVGLALCLGVTLGQLLDPTGPGHLRDEERLDIGPGRGSLDPWGAHAWFRDRIAIRAVEYHDGTLEPKAYVAPELHPRARKAVEAVIDRTSPMDPDRETR